MSGRMRDPVFRGFAPDPAIVRVGNDYVIATSTFEWFPGVQIHQPQTDAFTPPVPNVSVELRGEVDYERLRFAHRVRVGEWTWLAQQFDASILSDEATPGLPNFTGAFAGMACQDRSGARCPVDFDWFDGVERPYRADRFGT